MENDLHELTLSINTALFQDLQWGEGDKPFEVLLSYLDRLNAEGFSTITHSMSRKVTKPITFSPVAWVERQLACVYEIEFGSLDESYSAKIIVWPSRGEE